MTAAPEVAVERKLSLAELTDMLIAYRDTAEGMDGDDGPDAELIRAKLNQIESLHTNKVDRYCAFLKWIESEQAALKADKQRFERRQKAYKRIEDVRYDGARDLMRQNGISQMKGRAFTMSLCDGKRRLEITDESLIPEQYTVVIPEQVIPARRVVAVDEVEAALKRGEPVAGARLVDGDPYLRVT